MLIATRGRGISLGLACIAVLVSSCRVPPPDPADIPPPEIRANGVAGVVTSYCRAMNYCADGGIGLQDDYPIVELPVRLTFAEPITHITAFVSATGRDDQPVALIGADEDGVPREGAISIQDWPDGLWQWLTVSVGFPEEVSVSAAWELEEPSVRAIQVSECEHSTGAYLVHLPAGWWTNPEFEDEELGDISACRFFAPIEFDVTAGATTTTTRPRSIG